MIFYIAGYLLLGIITIFIMAYDPFSQSYDFGLSDGWEFWWWQRYILWLVIIIACPYFFITGITKKIKNRKYVKEWRKNGSFIRKL